MSNVLPDDLRVLEFPDSDNFHVNPDPWQHVPCTPFLAESLVARTLSGTSGHKTKQGAMWEDSVTGLL